MTAVMDYSQLGAAAAATEDLTQESAGFKREIPAKGVAMLRFTEYLETGKHEARPGSGYKSAQKVMLGFELNHKKHLIEIDGKMVPQKFTIRMNKGTTGASGYRKLFKLMNDACGGGNKHFVQMLGKPFLGEIFHKEGTKEEGKETPVYANLNNDSGYSLKAPVQVDALTEAETPVPIPEVVGEIKAFLWENEGVSDEQIQAMWDGIYIEGTRQNEKNEEVSKNWLQELIMKNLDWDNSRTKQVVSGEEIALDGDEVDAGQAALDAQDDELPTL